ncbi:MAG TPA: hypothetical protein VMB71_01180 [Acetobacteraceae bacterium]|nr:hypothetical protein [Acetobacteraceae bacterium]
MKLRNLTVVALLAGVLLAQGSYHTALADEVRPALGKPLQSALAAMRAGRYPQAMNFVRQADAVPGKTPHETYLVEQTRAAIAERSGDTATEAAAYQRLLATGQVAASEQVRIYQAEAALSYKAHDYPATVNWVAKYFKAGGTAPEMRTLQIQALYLSKNYKAAGQLQKQVVAAEMRAGRTPAENDLLLLYNCQKNDHDNTAALGTIKQLVYYYQKPDYWRNVIDTLRAKSDFSDRLLFEVYRLEFALNLVNSSSDAMEMAELAVQAKLPGEAKEIVDKSYAGGLFGNGADAARELRLKNLVDKTYNDMRATLDKQEADVATDRDGNRMLQLGETYVSYGMFDKGIPLMIEAMKKDDLRHPEDAKLDLGIAYLRAGNKRQAIAELRAVRGADGTEDIAQLWLLHIGH